MQDQAPPQCIHLESLHLLSQPQLHVLCLTRKGNLLKLYRNSRESYRVLTLSDATIANEYSMVGVSAGGRHPWGDSPTSRHTTDPSAAPHTASRYQHLLDKSEYYVNVDPNGKTLHELCIQLQKLSSWRMSHSDEGNNVDPEIEERSFLLDLLSVMSVPETLHDHQPDCHLEQHQQPPLLLHTESYNQHRNSSSASTRNLGHSLLVRLTDLNEIHPLFKQHVNNLILQCGEHKVYRAFSTHNLPEVFHFHLPLESSPHHSENLYLDFYDAQFAHCLARTSVDLSQVVTHSLDTERWLKMFSPSNGQQQQYMGLVQIEAHSRRRHGVSSMDKEWNQQAVQQSSYSTGEEDHHISSPRNEFNAPFHATQSETANLQPTNINSRTSIPSPSTTTLSPESRKRSPLLQNEEHIRHDARSSSSSFSDMALPNSNSHPASTTLPSRQQFNYSNQETNAPSNDSLSEPSLDPEVESTPPSPSDSPVPIVSNYVNNHNNTPLEASPDVELPRHSKIFRSKPQTASSSNLRFSDIERVKGKKADLRVPIDYMNFFMNNSGNNTQKQPAGRESTSSEQPDNDSNETESEVPRRDEHSTIQKENAVDDQTHSKRKRIEELIGNTSSKRGTRSSLSAASDLLKTLRTFADTMSNRETILPMPENNRTEEDQSNLDAYPPSAPTEEAPSDDSEYEDEEPLPQPKLPASDTKPIPLIPQQSLEPTPSDYFTPRATPYSLHPTPMSQIPSPDVEPSLPSPIPEPEKPSEPSPSLPEPEPVPEERPRPSPLIASSRESRPRRFVPTPTSPSPSQDSSSLFEQQQNNQTLPASYTPRPRSHQEEDAVQHNSSHAKPLRDTNLELETPPQTYRFLKNGPGAEHSGNVSSPRSDTESVDSCATDSSRRTRKLPDLEFNPCTIKEQEDRIRREILKVKRKFDENKKRIAGLTEGDEHGRKMTELENQKLMLKLAKLSKERSRLGRLKR